MDNIPLPGSFRDPSGFLFYREGEIYRQINTAYREDYDLLMNSGLYKALVDSSLLIPHSETDISHAIYNNAYKVIKPEHIPFISYPYEWCFSQLKSAALITLNIQKIALEYGMSLKDASAYNVQFKDGKPVFIDTSSFERLREDKPWDGYGQFCQHFLAPLALMNYKDVRLNRLLCLYIDGVPLDLASALLPPRTYLNRYILMHIHLHAKSQKHYSGKILDKKQIRIKFTVSALKGLIDNLESCIRHLTWHAGHKGGWADYYKNSAGYGEDGLEHKKEIVTYFLREVKPGVVWDLGANTGLFSRIASDMGMHTISFDNDPSCVEISYRASVDAGEKKILPLFLDLTNPSPSIGWENQERASILERGPTDAVIALGLMHHIAISNNLPMDRIASFFDKICKSLIIEFIPKSDPRVQQLLSTREDMFSDYTRQVFENEFNKYFVIQRVIDIKGTNRFLCLMRKR